MQKIIKMKFSLHVRDVTDYKTWFEYSIIHKFHKRRCFLILTLKQINTYVYSYVTQRLEHSSTFVRVDDCTENEKVFQAWQLIKKTL